MKPSLPRNSFWFFLNALLLCFLFHVSSCSHSDHSVTPGQESSSSTSESDNEGNSSTTESLEPDSGPIDVSQLQQDYRRSSTPLSDYVYAPDEHFSYEVKAKSHVPGYTFYVIKMTSQEWLSEAEVEDPIWWHWLSLLVPDAGPATNQGLLLINGGSRTSSMPDKIDDAANLVLKLIPPSPVGVLSNVPNQPIKYASDPSQTARTEDAMIAWGWKQFIDRGAQQEDAEWLARLPMTKATVRAMDVMSDVVKRHYKGSLDATLDSFVVTGASKRGWTTWTVGATDKRVSAIIPIVIPVGNLEENFLHHYHVYGRWAPAIHDYEETGFMNHMGTEEMKELAAVEDPYSYREELSAIPTFEINVANGQFFLPDAWKFYYGDSQETASGLGWKGEKHMRFLPNADHSLGGQELEAGFSIVNFYKMVLNGEERPAFQWWVDRTETPEYGITHFSTDPQEAPKRLTLWRAHNPENRYFIKAGVAGNWLDDQQTAYQAINIPINSDGVYEIDPYDPAWNANNEDLGTGWLSYFIEIEYPNGLKESTGPVVLPNTFVNDPFNPEW